LARKSQITLFIILGIVIVLVAALIIIIYTKYFSEPPISPGAPADIAGDALAVNMFVEDCIKNKLLVVPSTSFSRRDDHFRVSFAVTGRELDKGVEILKALGQDSRGWHS